MSSVVVQVGQCGNQIGHQFWKLVGKNDDCKDGRILVHSERDHHYFRSINVDSEPKVVQKIIKASSVSNVRFRERNIILGRRGRGTNWALGYHGMKDQHEDRVFAEALEATRKEIERCDAFSGVIMYHSLSGGTGSGLGSRLCESLRDDFPMHYMINCIVAPHCSGESPLQHYNSLLCLATLQRNSDALILVQNDEILAKLQRQSHSEEEETGRSVTFAHMNRHIAECLAGVFLPIDSLTPSSGISIGSEPGEMVRSVCPLPATKFVHLNHLSKSKQSWDNLAGLALQYYPNRDPSGKQYSCLSSLVIARGDLTNTFSGCVKKLEHRVKQTYNAVQWNPFPVDFWIGRKPLVHSKDCLASITIAANSSVVVPYLTHTVETAWLKYQSKAYLHWYDKYGCTQADFEESFNALEDVIHNYNAAIK